MDNHTFKTLEQLAEYTGLSAKWLREQAQAGGIPSLRMGRRLMFHQETVERALIQQLETTTERTTQ